MDHFVQYHNPDGMRGTYKPAPKQFAIFTDKYFSTLQGATVWLVTGEGRPRQYSLCSTFEVDTIEHKKAGRFRFRVSGTVGRYFDPFIEIGALPWFPELLKATGNFAWFQHIHGEAVVSGLQRIAAAPRALRVGQT